MWFLLPGSGQEVLGSCSLPSRHVLPTRSIQPDLSAKELLDWALLPDDRYLHSVYMPVRYLLPLWLIGTPEVPQELLLHSRQCCPKELQCQRVPE